MRWAYGLTTVPCRLTSHLPRTLRSLAAAGFDRPRLFIDGVGDPYQFEGQKVTEHSWDCFGLETTIHSPKIRTFGNWTLGLAELYIREPTAERYAMFQDDFVTYPNLRAYLERCRYPDHGYWNLYTAASNQAITPRENGKEKQGWYLSNQYGRGAVALVFSRQAVLTLLTHQHMVERPMDAQRGWKSIDGGIVTALSKAGWQEWVHNPSLVQHTGLYSSMGNRPHKLADSFQGEEVDAMSFLSICT